MSTSIPTIINREHWLTELVQRLEPLVAQQSKKMPKWRISCSFPVTRGRPKAGNYRIGECWIPERSSDGTSEIFISPVLDDPVKIADVTLHEMCHAVLPPGVGHKAPFARLAKAVGLEGKPTATEASDALKIKLKAIIDELGPYPHKALNAEGGKKQTTRLLASECPSCGYKARITSKWLMEVGPPICPLCQQEFADPTSEDFQENPLSVREQSVEYAFEGTTRFSLRMYRTGDRIKWAVIDFGQNINEFFAEATSPRVVSADDREDAINIVESVKEGLLTLDELEYTDEEKEEFDTEEDPESTEEDWAKDFYEHEETADFEDGILSKEEEAEYAKNCDSREAKVTV